MKLKVSVAIEEGLVERLDKIGSISNESRSQIIERMIRDNIESTEQFANLLANPEARKMLIREFNKPEVLKAFAHAMGEDVTPSQGQRMAEAVEQIGQAASMAKKRRGKK